MRQLAEECQRLGMPELTEASLGNIERGQKEGAKRGIRRVTAEELVVLAVALDATPLQLMYPFDKVRAVKVLPSVEAGAWDAAAWFAGRAAFPRPEAFDPEFGVYEKGSVAVELWEQHERQLFEWRIRSHQAKQADRRAPHAADPDEAVKAHRRAEQVANSLWEIRRQMRQHKILTPELPEELRYIDTDKTPLNRAVEQRLRSDYPDQWVDEDQEEAARGGRSDQAG
ncbi:hypothetical protein O7626_19505 [Micromonospora sp. WMMD1102]|uniref:hypothetical protein n=1 Tax=Micromonospora sp. WMMD1102 TaxID=3016105 RepID=UPI00241584C9|nr:hypothetical protein [Micromonospora sp. WMMD1102]MDG4788101.1 hypothetical protein [Micromonospora sp. WMMD1102]